MFPFIITNPLVLLQLKSSLFSPNLISYNWDVFGLYAIVSTIVMDRAGCGRGTAVEGSRAYKWTYAKRLEPMLIGELSRIRRSCLSYICNPLCSATISPTVIHYGIYWQFVRESMRLQSVICKVCKF